MTEGSGVLAATAAAWGVDTDLAPPDDPLPNSEWRGFFSAVVHQRVIGMLAGAVAAGAWPVDDTQREQVLRSHRTWMGAALRLERQLVAVGSRLGAEGIDVLVLKGPAAAHLDYPDPSLRCFGDIDLLIAPDRIEVARDLLLASGGRRHFAEPRPGFDRRFSKGLSITTPDHLEIDLHRTLATGPFGLAIDLGELRADSDAFAIAGQTFATLGRAQRFLHACYHAVLGTGVPRLVPLRDIAATAPTDDVELGRTLALASSWRGEAVVAEAVRAASERLAWHAPPALAAWSEAHGGGRRDRRWLRGYQGARRAYAIQAITAIEAVPGLQDKAAYALAVALPADARRGAARRDRYRRGLLALRRSLRR